MVAVSSVDKGWPFHYMELRKLDSHIGKTKPRNLALNSYHSQKPTSDKL